MIRRWWLQLSIVAVALTLATTSGAQTRDTRSSAPAAPAPTGTGSISGNVTSGDATSRPLRMANVVLIGAATGVLKVTSTDRDGKFAFASLPADRYTVGASKLPYLGAVAGARRPARPGTPIVLADGQKVADAVIRLPPAAAISGVVLDEFGQPASALVGAQRRRLQNGVPVFVDSGMTTATDERGSYRLSGLPPGEYVVSAYRTGFMVAAPRQLTDAEVNDALRGNLPSQAPLGPPVRFAPSYYPGTPRRADASVISLSVGDERAGVDFRVEPVATLRVEGSVVTADGQVPASATVILATAAGSSSMGTAFSSRVNPNGRFSIFNAPPGSYILNCVASGPQAGQFAVMPLELSGVDQTGIQLVLRPPMSMTGRVAFDGGSAIPALNGFTVPFKSMLAASGGGSAQVSVGLTDAKGTFNIQRISPGKYVFGGAMYFGANATSVTWALQSVVADGKDITDLPIEITPDTLPKDVVVTFSDKWQGVSGKLLQPSGAPATDHTVIVFPSNKAYWQTGSRRILTARPDSHGQFTLAGPGVISLPAGEYLLAAVTELDRDEQFDPSLLASLVGSAVPLSIQPGEKKVQDLVIR